MIVYSIELVYSMAKVNSVYICQQCGYKSSQYLGKCPQCDSWNSLVETIEKENAKVNKPAAAQSAIIDLSQIDKTYYLRLSTELEEFNRVLGGGIVLGSLILVSGDPGIGKSTLLTQFALNISSKLKMLYVAGEESAQQIKIRADRIKPNAKLPVLNEVDVDVIVGTIEQFKPDLVIVDSIQTLETTDLESVAGSLAQVRECAHRLQKVAKNLHIPIFLVGHVTKEGAIAGPKTLEHLVDVVLNLEGDPISQFRVLRSTKNRFGPTDEVGIFEMADQGMMEVKNPSKLFLETRINAPGSAVVATLTGIRPLLIEIQALVTRTSLPVPRRTGAGIDNNRLQLLVAVLQKRLSLMLFDKDIYVNITGGIKLNEPAADLGICLAIISSFKDHPLKKNLVSIGEVGLLGEIRMVRELDKRIKEAKKLGFLKVVSPSNAKTLQDATKLAFEDKK